MRDEQITNTFLGREYGWDRVSDVNVEMLRHNRECNLNVLANPDKFPDANLDFIAQHVAAVDDFFARHGDVLANFA